LKTRGLDQIVALYQCSTAGMAFVMRFVMRAFRA
jgi:hypothetical protein